LSPVVDVKKDVLMVSESSRGSSGEFVGGLRMSLEVNKPASGPGCTDAVKAGPIQGPKILQVSEPKEAKPNRLQAVCSGEGAGSSFEGPIVASISGQNREGISSETAHGTIDELVSGQFWEGFSLEILSESEQTGTEEAYWPGLGGQVIGEVLGMTPAKSKVTGRGFSPEIPPETEQTGKMEAYRSGHGG
jgi:hypothetical protein